MTSVVHLPLSKRGTFGGTYSRALDINNLGQITGQASLPADLETHAFFYLDGTLNDLGVPFGRVSSVGHAINDAGMIVGETEAEAMIYFNGHMLAERLGVARTGNDINNAGQIVGTLQNNHAFLFSHGRLRDLGTLYGRRGLSFATAINNTGQIVGYSVSSDGSTTHAFIYENGVMTDLGTLYNGYSVAFGINDNGVVVGESDGAAFIYQNGIMTDLNSITPHNSGLLRLENAFGINDGGRVVGRGVFLNKGSRAVLLTPGEPN